MVILDGEDGLCIINPSKASLAEYQKRQDEYISFQKKLQAIKDLPALTKDGKEIPIPVSVGDTILMDKYSSQEVTIDDEEYIIVRADDIIAIVEQ